MHKAWDRTSPAPAQRCRRPQRRPFLHRALQRDQVEGNSAPRAYSRAVGASPEVVHPIVAPTRKTAAKRCSSVKGSPPISVGLPEDESRDLLAQLYARQRAAAQHLSPPMAASRPGVLGQPFADPLGRRLPERICAASCFAPPSRATRLSDSEHEPCPRNIPFARLAATSRIGYRSVGGRPRAPAAAQAEGESASPNNSASSPAAQRGARPEPHQECGKREGINIKVNWTPTFRWRGSQRCAAVRLHRYRRCRCRSTADHLGIAPTVTERQGRSVPG